MKYLGIDYGAKNVGIAISDGGGMIAFPRADIPNDDKLLSFITRMIREEKIEMVIVGDTRTVSGRENPITSEAEAFTVKLGEEAGIPIEFAPEMWSSIEASRYAPEGSGHSNAAAAAIILQRFLDTKGNATV